MYWAALSFVVGVNFNRKRISFFVVAGYSISNERG